MNTNKKHSMSYSILICYVVLCHVNLINSSNHTGETSNEDVLITEKPVDLSRIHRHIGKFNTTILAPSSDNCLEICNFHCKNGKSPISTSIFNELFQDIIGKILKHFELISVIIPDIYNKKLVNIMKILNPIESMTKLIFQCITVNEIIQGLLEPFHKIFKMNSNTQDRECPIKSLIELKSNMTNFTTKISHLGLPCVDGLINTIKEIQSHIECIHTNIFKHIIPILNNIKMNKTTGDSSEIIQNEIKNPSEINSPDMENIYDTLIEKFIKNRMYLHDFMNNLKNGTISIIDKFRFRGPILTFIHGIFDKVKNTMEKPMDSEENKKLQPMNIDWKKLYDDMKKMIESLKNIPLSIVQIFRNFMNILKPSTIIKRNWEKFKKFPTFIGQCYSSKMDKMFGITHGTLFAPTHFMPKIWEDKSLRYFPWKILKSKLCDECTCD